MGMQHNYSRTNLISLTLGLLVAGASAPASITAQQKKAGGTLAPKPNPALPNVVVLATGGTIAGAAGSDVQSGYTSGQVGV